MSASSTEIVTFSASHADKTNATGAISTDIYMTLEQQILEITMETVLVWKQQLHIFTYMTIKNNESKLASMKHGINAEKLLEFKMSRHKYG